MSQIFDIVEELEKERKKNKELEEKYSKALELLADFNMPCEVYEGKIPNKYCEEHCEVGDEIYKKCWNKYIELELKGDNK